MPTREIARDQWSSFLGAFSLQHEGWIVTLEVVGELIGDQEEGNRLPLAGIGVELEGRTSHIAIMLGGRSDAHLTHIIEGATRVWVKEPEALADEAVEFECEDGTRTIMYFCHVPPERGDRQLPRPG